jgi:hypothetical protein
MAISKKTGYAVAKRSSSSGKYHEVFGTVSSKGGITRVMDAESYERAAKRAGKVLKSTSGETRSIAASDLARTHRK